MISFNDKEFNTIETLPVSMDKHRQMINHLSAVLAGEHCECLIAASNIMGEFHIFIKDESTVWHVKCKPQYRKATILGATVTNEEGCTAFTKYQVHEMEPDSEYVASVARFIERALSAARIAKDDALESIHTSCSLRPGIELFAKSAS